MRILGIDPGSIKTGWGIVEEASGKPAFVECGVIRTKPADTFAKRLHRIHLALEEAIEIYRPTQAALESAFVSRNAQSALKLGHARGVCLLAIAQADIAFMEYTPAEVKSSVTGHGRAGKDQVNRMIRMLLHIQTELSEDAADALAVALCHYQRSRTLHRLRRVNR